MFEFLIDSGGVDAATIATDCSSFVARSCPGHLLPDRLRVEAPAIEMTALRLRGMKRRAGHRFMPGMQKLG
ncbi:hypothetical protein [Burkholderia cepacia]|uniref:Uncharacterized protein n=1 Tax=Burkholderia cepacia TaxID=292 RepID=A0A8I1AV15_BURCE|nr:hypothetical protein [Burkholderia cepacia]MBX4145045.1 hypothetical protein [Ralstonia pickettii]MBA9896385.1 hypothetical protein [Burkholderia cepacia]MBA9945477.1 hypothetical protein [Burkholderia cepacia]MBA9991698.1 hypothetical protein [Burkholderia cepacia]MBB0000439.1 hypothetical protein [Burkholderia cepacia]